MSFGSLSGALFSRSHRWAGSLCLILGFINSRRVAMPVCRPGTASSQPVNWVFFFFFGGGGESETCRDNELSETEPQKSASAWCGGEGGGVHREKRLC